VTTSVVLYADLTVQTLLPHQKDSSELAALAKMEKLQSTNVPSRGNKSLSALITKVPDALPIVIRRFAFTCQMANSRPALSDLPAPDITQLILNSAVIMVALTVLVFSRTPLM
jgi:hypothetical protein